MIRKAYIRNKAKTESYKRERVEKRKNRLIYQTKVKWMVKAFKEMHERLN